MGAARNTVPKWADPETSWDEPSRTAEITAISPAVDVDRFHNHEELSPEAMAQAISELQASVQAMDGRLAQAAEGADEAVTAVKGLGASMVKMGDALSKRVRSLEETAEAQAEAERLAAEAAEAPASPPRVEKTLKLSLALTGVLVAVVAVVAIMGPHRTMSGPSPSHAVRLAEQ